MQIKRGLIYLVLLLILIPIIYSAPRSATVIDDTPQPSYLSCDEGTRFATCKPNSNLFCSNQNLILNGGFETDSNQDGIPNLFSIDGILGTNLLISPNPFSGLKSALIKNQWSSFDYQGSFFGQATILQPSTDYIFFSFVKGTCQDNSLRVFYGDKSGPGSQYLCGRDTPCNLIPVTNGWSRLIVQFNSDEIATTVQQENLQIPIIQNLRVECSDSTPFELLVDNMHLQPLNSQPQLVENCQICGGCGEGLFCAPDGSCVSDLSSFYSDEELMERCIAENNFALCGRIQSPTLKPVAFNIASVENGVITQCQDIICEQSVLYFSCLDQGRTNCGEESLSLFAMNPNFANGGDIYIRYQEGTRGRMTKVEKFKLGSGREHPITSCEIHVRRDLDGSRYNDYYQYPLGTIISENSNLRNLATEVLGTKQTVADTDDNFPWNMNRDCGSNNCNLLEGDVIAPKADLLCGGDSRWHLCDRDGIKASPGIIGFPEYLCDGNSGTWVELI